MKEISGDNPNGIYLEYNVPSKEEQTLGIDIAKFIVRSYIVKYIVKEKKGEWFTAPTIINIVLNEINKDGIINTSVLEKIITVLNHPHFKGCNNIHELQKKASSVDNLNERYDRISVSSDEEQMEKSDSSNRKSIERDFPKTDPRHPDFHLD